MQIFFSSCLSMVAQLSLSLAQLSPSLFFFILVLMTKPEFLQFVVFSLQHFPYKIVRAKRDWNPAQQMIGLKIHSSLLYYIWWTPTLIGGNCISKFLGTVSQNKNKKKSSGPDNQTYEGDLEEKEKNYEQEFNILCIKSSVPFKPFKPFKPLYKKFISHKISIHLFLSEWRVCSSLIYCRRAARQTQCSLSTALFSLSLHISFSPEWVFL